MAPLKCFSVMVGMRHTPTRRKHFAATDDEKIHAITFRHFPDGFTVLNADGGWFDPERRRFVAEESRQVIVSARSVRVLRAWCADLAAALRQKELLVIELGPVSTFRARRTRARKKNR